MTSKWVKRCTVLIPLPIEYNQDNPDSKAPRTPIEKEKYEKTAIDLVREFNAGGVIHDMRESGLLGFWQNKNVVDKDVLVYIEIDLPDTQETRAWLEKYGRTVLLSRFQQDAIYMKIVPQVETLLVERLDAKIDE
jgi:hypothetical protein